MVAGMPGVLDELDIVALLDVDPDLGADIGSEEQLRSARRRAVAATIEIAGPGWDPKALNAHAKPGWLGLFVVEGVMLRRVRVGRRPACELFGPGDLIRPWDTDGEYAPLPISVDWLVLVPSRLAILDTAFVLRIARWPTINAHIVGRVAQRARYLALINAASHLPRADARLLILFHVLAERWGKITPNGVQIVLPVTHAVLAMLIGTQRPTVTIALQRLTRAGFLVRERKHHWLLTNHAVEHLARPESLQSVADTALHRP
jgi:CRP/FNR family transcriptional regulator, cyclic AMP receptor protein